MIIWQGSLPDDHDWESSRSLKYAMYFPPDSVMVFLGWKLTEKGRKNTAAKAAHRFRLRSAAIHLYERLLQNGAQTKGLHPHLFFAPYSVSCQRSPEQSL